MARPIIIRLHNAKTLFHRNYFVFLYGNYLNVKHEKVPFRYISFLGFGLLS